MNASYVIKESPQVFFGVVVWDTQKHHKMKKVLNLVKKRKTSLSSQHPSPSRISLDQVSSSVGIESASAASLVYHSTPNLHPIGKNMMITYTNSCSSIKFVYRL